MQVTRLEMREGKHDKVYIATLDGQRLKLEWGRRGNTLQCKAPFDGQSDVGIYTARKTYEDKISEKRAKGYQIMETASVSPARPPAQSAQNLWCATCGRIATPDCISRQSIHPLDTGHQVVTVPANTMWCTYCAMPARPNCIESDHDVTLAEHLIGRRAAPPQQERYCLDCSAVANNTCYTQNHMTRPFTPATRALVESSRVPFHTPAGSPPPSARRIPVVPDIPTPVLQPGMRRIRSNPNLPQPLSSYRPMLLKSIDRDQAEKYIKDPNWVMQQKADGVRTIALIEHPKVETHSRTAHEVPLTQETSTSLLALFQVRSVTDNESCGDNLVVFDILANGAGDMRAWPLAKRIEHLDGVASKARRMNLPGLSFIQTAHTEEQKRAALVALNTGGAEGVVFKYKDSTYEAGESDLWLKLKFKASATVLAIAPHAKGKRSVEIAVIDATGNQIPVGTVSVPDKWGPLPAICGRLIEVEYLYAFRNGSLIQPALKAIRTDKLTADTVDSLQFKGEER